MSHTIWTIIIIAMFLASPSVNSKEITDYDPLFQSHDTLVVDIEAPFASVVSERSDSEEVEGTFRYTTGDGSQVAFDIALRVRGNRRLDPSVCAFPPLRINYVKSQTKDTLFDKQDKVKLVTHCRGNSKPYEQALVSEYVTYRMLNLLTDASFAVRPLRVRYVYTDSERIAESFAFLIEPKDRIGKRIGGEPMDVQRIGVYTLRASDLNLTSVFEYFIGNTDFSPVATAPDEDCCHNQVVFDTDEEKHNTVPYDFDQAGLVSAPHAAPNPRFGLRTVRTRLYRGRCVNNHLLPATFEKFRAHRAGFVELIESQPELTNASRKRMISYIDRFYKTIDNPKRVEKEFIKACI